MIKLIELKILKLNIKIKKGKIEFLIVDDFNKEKKI